MQIRFIFAIKLIKTRYIIPIGKEIDACSYNQLYALKVSQMRCP